MTYRATTIRNVVYTDADSGSFDMAPGSAPLTADYATIYDPVAMYNPVLKYQLGVEVLLGSPAGQNISFDIISNPSGHTIAEGDICEMSALNLSSDLWVTAPVTAAKIRAAVASAFALYPDGATVHIPGGQGDIVAEDATTPAVAIRNDNITIDVGFGTTFVPFPGAGQHTWFLVQPSALSVAPSATLTANSARHSNVITIGAGVPAGWAVGDIIQVSQTEIALGEADGVAIMKIKSKDATTVTFEDGLPAPFTTARAAAAVKLNTVDNVTLIGIRGDGTGNTNTDTTLIGAQNTQNFRATDCAGNNFTGHFFQAQLAGYKMHLERLNGDLSGQPNPSARASIECTYVTHLTMVDCHADNSPGFGIMLWACAYPRTFGNRANGCADRNLKHQNCWFGSYYGSEANNSVLFTGISDSGFASYGNRYIGCVAHGNFLSNFYVIDGPDEIWVIGSSFKATTQVPGTGQADITLGATVNRVHIVDCDYDSIYDGTPNSLVMPSRAGHAGVIYDASALKTISATAAETSLFPATLKGPGGNLPADFWAAPRHIRIRITGTFSNNNTDTIRIKVKLGATIALDTGAVTPGSALAGVHFEIICDLNIYTSGAAAAIQGQGMFRLRGAGFTDGYVPIANSGNTISTLVAQAIDVTATYSSNNASNVMVARVASIEVLS